MKILLATLEYPPFKGGVANYYYNLVKYWPKKEEIQVVDNNQGQLMFKYGPFSWLKSFFVFFKKINNKEINYLIVGHILPLGTVAMLLSFIKPLKYAIIIHGLDFSKPLTNRRKRWLIKIILKRSDKIICANSYVLSLVKNFYPKISGKLGLVNPGIDSVAPEIKNSQIEAIKEKYNLKNSFVLFSLGRLVRRKGFDLVIKAVNEISSDNNLQYFIAGTGPDKAYLQSLVKNNQDKASIYFLDNLTEEEKWAWMKIMNVFIMPARKIGVDFEGFGIVYLEANLLKKPVIAGDSGGVKDAVAHKVNGLMVNPENAEEIKLAILKLKNNPDLSYDLGEKGCKRLENFSWHKQAQLFYKMIN